MSNFIEIQGMWKKAVKLNVSAQVAIHEAAVASLAHCRDHGDVSLCQYGYEQLGGKNSSTRTNILKVWFARYSGNQMTAEGGTWKMKKPWDPSKFDLEGATQNPYWTLEPQKDIKEMSWETILGSIKGYLKKVDKAASEDKFSGNPDAVKALLTNVIDYADGRAKLLSAQDLGKIKAAQAATSIIENGTELGAVEAAA